MGDHREREVGALGPRGRDGDNFEFGPGPVQRPTNTARGNDHRVRINR